MKIFISGGCKNGKTYHAQRLAKAQENGGGLYYVATMKPVDREDEDRIENHRRQRSGWGFSTVEQPFNVEDVLRKCDKKGSFLLDSVTALLANEMFGGSRINEGAGEETLKGLTRLINNIDNIVIVSDYIYSDASPYGHLTEKYRKTLAEIDCAIAKNCDVVLETAYTNIIVHKGEEVFGGLNEKML